MKQLPCSKMSLSMSKVYTVKFQTQLGAQRLSWTLGLSFHQKLSVSIAMSMIISFVTFKVFSTIRLVFISSGFPKPIVAIMLPNGTRVSGDFLPRSQIDLNEFYMCTAKNELGESNMISNFTGFNLLPIIGSIFLVVFLSASKFLEVNH